MAGVFFLITNRVNNDGVFFFYRNIMIVFKQKKFR